MPTADRLLREFCRRRDPHFLHKHHNAAYPALSMLEGALCWRPKPCPCWRSTVQVWSRTVSMAEIAFAAQEALAGAVELAEDELSGDLGAQTGAQR